MCQTADAMLQIVAYDPLHQALPCLAAQPSSTSSSIHATDGPARPTPSPREWQSISTTAIRAAATAYWLQIKIPWVLKKHTRAAVEVEVELNVHCKLMHTLLQLLASLLSGMLFTCFVTFRLFSDRVCHCHSEHKCTMLCSYCLSLGLLCFKLCSGTFLSISQQCSRLVCWKAHAVAGSM